MGREARRKREARESGARVVEAISISDGTLVQVRLTAQEERARVAHHEAAHAVTAWSLGVPVRRISVDSDEAHAIMAGLLGVTKRAVGTPEEIAIIALAGLVFDRRLEEIRGVRFKYEGGDEHHDGKNAKACAAVALNLPSGTPWPDKAAAIALVESWYRRAAQLLDASSTGVEALGAALLKQGALEAPALAETLGPLPPISAETLEARRAGLRTAIQLGWVDGSEPEDVLLGLDLLTVAG